MTDEAWPLQARAQSTDLAVDDPTHRDIDRARPGLSRAHRSLETLVSSLSFEPFLHFQFRCDPPLHVEITSRSRAPMYIVGSDDCQLQWEHNPPLALNAGDVVFLPHAGRHRIYTDERAPLQQFSDLVSQGVQRRGKSYDIVMGHSANTPPLAAKRWSGSFYWRSDLSAHPLMASLPPVLVLARADAMTWLPAMTQLVAWMADIRGGGNGVGLTQVMNSLLQRLVLAWLNDPGRSVPGLAPNAAAPRDERLLAALEGIHTRCAHPWTADSLAALCHMSRTQFTQRFQAQTGLPPMRYLMQWRLHLAERLLKEQRLTLQQVADAVGYSTGAILARAYKRERGVTPGSDTLTEQSAAKSR